MKKVILAFVVIFGLNTAIHAQGMQGNQRGGGKGQNLTPDQRASEDATRAEARLGLNADQKSKWQAASLERINANEPLRSQMRSTTDQAEKQRLGEQMKQNSQKFDTTVEAFLTADQKTKWEQEKQERKNNRKGGGGGNGGMME